MDGFKTLPKMQHFKEGGKVAPKAMCYGGKMKKGGDVKDDMAQDKKLIKKAFKQHDEAEHDKEPTEIKLRKGGRAKKETGTVKKFKDGGPIGVYGAKKKSGDLDSIEKAKDTKPKKAAAPSKASTKPAMKGSDVAKEKSKPAGTTKAVKVKEDAKKAEATSGVKGGPNKYKTGGKVKKMADGSSVGNPMEEAHDLALMEQMQSLPAYMQLQLLQQQQNLGGNNALNGIANRMNMQQPMQQGLTNMPSGVNPNQD